ncbi:MAG: DUF1801 domain-containing protein [Candidatus Hydrogenedentales bacterium]
MEKSALKNNGAIELRENEESESPIDNYIRTFSGKTKERLEEIRKIISEEVPEAREKISYGMPTYDLFGNLVHFAGCANHIGFYPTASGVENFKKDIEGYKNSKGAIQFPVEASLPEQLIRRIVRFRKDENIKIEEEKKKKRGKKKIG